MKKIDKYILSTFLKKLGNVFGTLMFIFTFHTLWLFINELSGKDIGIINILKFLFFYLPNLIYITIPLAVILSSIMTFGMFAENYELVSMKSSGLSILRIMRSVIASMIVLSLITFYISNTLIPYSQYKTYSFRVNLKRLEPSIAITKGVFSDLGDYSIKVDDKYGKNGQYLKGIIIHKIYNSKNKITIKAEEGEFISNKKSDIVQLVLKNGNYYEDINYKKELPYVKADFEKYILNIDLSNFNKVDLSEEISSNSFRMLTALELSTALDSLQNALEKKIKLFSMDIYHKTGIKELQHNYYNEFKKDSFNALTIDELSVWKYKAYDNIFENALSNASSMLSLSENFESDIKYKKKNINQYIMSFNNKFSLAMTCIVLFFAAAPFGAIIKKGGIGLPLVVGVIMFLSYHFIEMFSRRLGEDGSINPVLASWMSNLIILPLGIYLTRRTTSDRGVFGFFNLQMRITFIIRKLQKFIKKYAKHK